MRALAEVNSLDKAEATLVQLGAKVAALGQTLPEVPVVHRFTPGLYIRECRLPADFVLVTKTHKLEHPFVISQGRCVVWTQEDGAVELRAPYNGITKPGTRRIIWVLEPVVWITFHVTDLTDPTEIERQIIVPNDNPLLGIQA